MSVSKMLAPEAQGHEFNTQDPSKTAEHGGLCWGGRDRKILQGQLAYPSSFINLLV